jgi:fatty acid synthase
MNAGGNDEKPSEIASPERVQSPDELTPIGDGTQVEFATELMPTQCLLKMKSNCGKQSNKPIFLVHPIEGVVSALAPLAENLNRPVYGLQCVSHAPLDSISDLAAYYVKQIRSVQVTGPYTIAGYSYGGCVAFEMVTQIERKTKEKCNLIMLDGSPTYVSWYTEAQSSRNARGTKAKDEAYALAYFGMVCAKLDYKLVSKIKHVKAFIQNNLNFRPQ